MSKKQRKLTGYYICLLALHLLLGIGAVAGGFGAVMDPSGESMGATTEMLKVGPFRDFLIPGLFLLVVNGLGNLAAAVGAWRRYAFQPYVSSGLGVVMMLWIVIQVIVLQSVVALHVATFLLGMAVTLVALILAWKQRLFPLDRAPFQRDPS